MPTLRFEVGYTDGDRLCVASAAGETIAGALASFLEEHSSLVSHVVYVRRAESEAWK